MSTSLYFLEFVSYFDVIYTS